MARTRHELDPGQKRDAIVAAARKLFVEVGYEATGMARIAAEAGVAPNTLYWYFDDKDALLIEILDALVLDAMADFAAVASRPLEDQLLWMVSKFDAVPALVNTVHARLDVSPAIFGWHARFHSLLESVLIAQLALRGMPEVERVPAARIAMFVVEGLLSHHAGATDARAGIAALLVSRLETPSRA